ncbi:MULTISPECIES: globin domain-containing protein [Staphylococcus]|uniref:nitric oxide dioxygenase n=1 Tax=Staphylococcus lugdunensis TaxID=28035 RepID=A0ABX6BWQ6_STALU|nr:MULTISPECIES: globin domain-containing protein [Staphylococcus]ADC87902.1 Flavohemoprotein [Staphylococcus lugdunensis HKU09-01]AMG62801.1 nitric oxide dioxygenase [Staphylococcus lugdunensis]ARB78127.1 nitric oxide dioxygenase [Staphylococcus lugdunensis]ARJ09650.1 nitric oxide dioxygenase [Staphylococcus lugdunensis]ARJ16685.1 nitric oxide dioxygenase [Staphylococcus lugdunensis]
MLTEKEMDIVQQTVPVLQEKGTEITSNFYNRMFKQHPELKNMFNQTNQQKGFQSTALAQSVLAAAINIEHLERIMPVVKEIAYKHCALQVPPAGYDIVGENLIAAIKDVVGLDDSSPIIQTWKNAYREIAQVFIDVEQEIYSHMLWEGFQPFKIVKIEELSSDIKAFTVESSQYDLSRFEPGEYITVDVSSDKMPYRAKRHYSIVAGTPQHLTFAVKRDVSTHHEGEVSTILHDELHEGDDINLSAPVGPFKVDNNRDKHLFLGAGIGVTPLVPMFKQVIDNDKQSHFIQVTADTDDTPFVNILSQYSDNATDASYELYDRSVQGYLKQADLVQHIDEQTAVYVCGGTKFLQSMISMLREMGVNESQIHFETFVPKLSVEV